MNTKDIIDILEQGLKMPFSFFWNPEKRIYFAYLLTSLLMALFVYKKLNIKHSFKSYVFSRKVWLGQSAKVDYLLVFFNSFIKIIVIGPYLIMGLYLAFHINELLMRQLGIPTFNISTPALVFIYTLSFTLINDFASYIVHYAQHKIPFLWEFHKIHHSATELNPITQYRIHPVELIINNAKAIFIFGLLTGFFDYLAVDTIDKLTFWGVNIFSFIFLLFGANLRHTHIPFSYFNVVEYIFISPFQHQIHHSINPVHFDKNMGSKLAIWDWLFGTLVRSEEVNETLSYGLGEEDKQYNSFSKNLYKPFVNIYNKMLSILT